MKKKIQRKLINQVVVENKESLVKITQLLNRVLQMRILFMMKIRICVK